MNRRTRSVPSPIRSALIVALTGLATTLSPTGGWAETEIVFIAHPDVLAGDLSRDDIAKIFMGKQSRWADGTKITVVEQNSNRRLRRHFVEEYLERSVRAIESYWRRQIFTGRGVPPRSLATEKAVVEFVRQTPGAVSYLSFAPGGVQQLHVRE